VNAVRVYLAQAVMLEHAAALLVLVRGNIVMKAINAVPVFALIITVTEALVCRAKNPAIVMTNAVLAHALALALELVLPKDAI